MTGTFPKNAGFTLFFRVTKGPSTLWEPPPQFSLFRAQRIPFGEPGCQGRFPGSTEFVRDRTQTRRKLRVQGGLVARFPAKPEFSAPPLESSEKSTFMAGPRDRYPERLVCQKFESFLQTFSFVPKR